LAIHFFMTRKKLELSNLLG